MRNLPTGTITLLFTDIEGSTSLLQQLGSRYGDVLKECQHLLRTAFQQWNGSEVDTQGDAFFVVFARATDAVAAAVNAQRTLAAHPWPEGVTVRVRMGIHTGEPQHSSEGYIGLDVHRAARIMSAGHGGQVLLSQTTRDLVDHMLPDDVRLRDIGEHRLKDLKEPSHLYQLVITGLRADFPPLRTLGLSSPRYALPTQPTSLVGREQEIIAVSNLLSRADVRLLTLIGTAGVGKTRLALSVAEQLFEQFSDGVYFVSLAQISNAHEVVPAITQKLGIREETDISLLDSVKSFLHGKHILLLLDNFEQVLHAAILVADLLSASPQLKILVTSRAVLHVQAERVFNVPPLTLPDLPSLAHTTQQPDLTALSQNAAIALFIQRAQTLKPHFRLTDANAVAIATICIRLDGLPLAIELAAARSKYFPPQILLRQLEQGLHSLTGGARDLPARQQTLRGAIAWSYELLTPEEQQVFRRLSVFVNGCTPEAAERVCTAAGPIEGNVWEIAETLVDKSLLRQQEQTEELRFWMLQTLREYGLECLATAGEMDVTRTAHAAHFLSLAEEADPYLLSDEQLYWLDLLEQEHENLRAAFEEILESVVVTSLSASASSVVEVDLADDVDHHDGHGRGRDKSGPYDDFATAPAEQALRLCIALAGFWEVRGYFREGWAFLERALAISKGVANFIRAKALFVGGFLAYIQDHKEHANTLLQESLALFQECGDQASVANVLRMQGNLAKTQSSYKQARSLLEDALAIYRRLDDKMGMASIYTVLAQVYISQGDYTKAISLLEECLALYKAVDENYLIAYPLYHLARTLFLSKSDPAQARSLAEESLALFKSVRDKRLTPYVLILLGQITLVQGEDTRARALLEESRTVLQELGDRFGTAIALIFLARTTATQGNLAQARTLYEEGWELLRKIDDKELSTSCLEGMGEVAAKQGAFKWAAQLWGTAATLRADIVAPMPPIYRAPYQQAVAITRAQLGETPFKAAWAEGGKVPLEHAICQK